MPDLWGRLCSRGRLQGRRKEKTSLQSLRKGRMRKSRRRSARSTIQAGSTGQRQQRRPTASARLRRQVLWYRSPGRGQPRRRSRRDSPHHQRPRCSRRRGRGQLRSFPEAATQQRPKQRNRRWRRRRCNRRFPPLSRLQANRPPRPVHGRRSQCPHLRPPLRRADSLTARNRDDAPSLPGARHGPAEVKRGRRFDD